MARALAAVSGDPAHKRHERPALLPPCLPQGCTVLAPAGDPVLAGFPALLDDPGLCAAFLTRWRAELLRSTATGAPPANAAELAAAFRLCATAVWAACGAQAVPPPGIANDMELATRRAGLIRQFLRDPGGVRCMACLSLAQPCPPARCRQPRQYCHHPCAATCLGSGANAWLHRPFSCEEVRCGLLEALGPTV